MILLDTHVWVWWATEPDRLSRAQKQVLSKEVSAISAITLWELTLLESKQRVTLDEPCLDWIAHNLETFSVRVLELSPSIAFRSNNLREFEHRDPADRIIVATAIDHSLTLLTVDQALIAYPHVKTL